MAGNLYEFIIRAKDEASKVLKDVAGNVASSSKGFKQQFADMSGASKTLALGLGGLTVAAGLFGKSAIDRASEMENLGAQFQTFTKSADGAKKLMQDINKFASSTPFETVELANASKQLLAFGVGADDVIGSLQTLGDVASATGQPIGELAYLYGTTRTQGRLYGQDLLQFTGRGIPMIKALAEQFGVAESEVKKLVEEGKVGFPEVQKALQSMTTAGGMFEGGMLAQSKTFSGMMSTFQDSISLAMAEVGTAMLPMMKALLGALISFSETLPGLAKNFVDFASALANNKPALVGIAVAIATMLTPAAITAAAALWGMVAPLLPLVAAATAAGTAVALLYTAWESNFLGIQDITLQAWAAIEPIFTKINDTFTNVLIPAMTQLGENMRNEISGTTTEITAKTQGMVDGLNQTIGTDYVNIFHIVGDALNHLKNSTIGVIVGLLEACGSFVSGLLNMFTTMFTTLNGMVASGWAMIKGVFGAVMSILTLDVKGFLDSVGTIFTSGFNFLLSYVLIVWDAIYMVISTVMGTIWAFIDGTLSNVNDTVTQKWEVIKGAVVSAVTGIADFVKKSFSDLVNSVTQFMQGAIDAAWALVPDFFKIGQNAAMGLTDGFANRMQAGIATVAAKVQSMAKAARDALEVKSPSRVFAEIGEFTAQGLEQGFLGGIDKLNAKIPSAIGGMVSATGGATEEIARPSFTPVATNAGGATTNTTNNISITLNAEGQDAETLTKQVLERLTRELQLIQLGAIR